MPDNPYESPSTSTSSAPEMAMSAGEMQIASQGKRFLNFILDVIVIQVLSTVGGFVLGVIFGVSRAAANQPITAADEASLELVGFVIGLLISAAYFVITEALFQRTLAKFLTGTLVVTADGRRPSFGQIVGRSFARFIPFEPFSFLGGKYPVGWHDSLSSTRVITTR